MAKTRPVSFRFVKIYNNIDAIERIYPDYVDGNGDVQPGAKNKLPMMVLRPKAAEYPCITGIRYIMPLVKGATNAVDTDETVVENASLNDGYYDPRGFEVNSYEELREAVKQCYPGPSDSIIGSVLAAVDSKKYSLKDFYNFNAVNDQYSIEEVCAQHKDDAQDTPDNAFRHLIYLIASEKQEGED